MEKNKQEHLEFDKCPKCGEEHSILIFDDQDIVECQNLNCSAIYRKKEYLEFLEFWEKLDHSLDEDFDKLIGHGKKLGFSSPNTSELFYIDAVAYSFDSENEIYRGHYSYIEHEDPEKEPEYWTVKEEDFRGK